MWIGLAKGLSRSALSIRICYTLHGCFYRIIVSDLASQAKVLSEADVKRILAVAAQNRHAARNRCICMISILAGLRATARSLKVNVVLRAMTKNCRMRLSAVMRFSVMRWRSILDRDRPSNGREPGATMVRPSVAGHDRQQEQELRKSKH